MRFIGLVMAAGLACMTSGTAFAQMITAVSLSPTGDSLLVAGDNRVLYTLDPETLEVTNRRYVPGMVRWLGHSGDGRTVLLRTDDRVFSAHSAGSFKTRYKVADISEVSHARDANRIALMENGYKAGVVHLLQAESGKSISRIELPEIRTDVIALDAAGSRALVLTKSAKSETEVKENPPSDLKGHAKYEFQQQKDGYVSTILHLDLQAGTFDSAETFYRVSFPAQVMMSGDRAAFVKSRHDSALVGPDGSTTLMNMGEEFIAGARLLEGGNTILLMRGTTVAFHEFADGAVGAQLREVEATRIDGPAERVTAVDVGADGTVYLGTSAYRLWKITPEATEIEAVAVF